MFSTLLIANRGEIARRIMRTARATGLKTVAVYSDADARALHVREADIAVRLGPAPAAESYLRAEAILEAAAATGADAIHPGYGFLSENADFAEAVIAAGLIFVGPTPAAIRAMGRKDEAKALMAAAGVPVTPGYQGDDQSEKTLKAAGADIGYPVLIKAVAGGGGKGMRKVERAEDFAAALTSAKREAASSFGDDRVLIEKFISGPRHIEVQVFGDAHGNVVHFYERDCSLQRRHQKVIEEAPAPGMTEEVRAAMTAAAVTAAKAVDYVGAGTVEFIVDGSGALRPDGFWFMEMNTRLQVEHPVTELVTGHDLVALQLKVAAGEALPEQSQITLAGHAFEARLYAEDPASGFLPSIGRLDVFEAPDAGVRVDSAVAQGDAITPFYDPMIAKLIVAGADRSQALDRLAEATGEVRVAGVATNAGFLRRCARDAVFAAGEADTLFLARSGEALTNPPQDKARAALALAGAHALGLFEASTADPWAFADGFRLNAPARLRVRLSSGGEEVEIAFTQVTRAAWRAEIGGATVEASELARADGVLSARVDGAAHAFAVRRIGDRLALFADGDAFVFAPPHPETAAEALEAGDEVKAPMPGKVIAVEAKPGARVARGQTLVVLEAMKMEHALGAPRDGVVAEIAVKAGAQTREGEVLARLEPEVDAPG